MGIRSSARADPEPAALDLAHGSQHCTIPLAVFVRAVARAPSRRASAAPSVAKLRAAGAIIIGKTHLDELGRRSSGLSTEGGQTVDAYDLARIPGGSSGGSAVAVAANLATVGVAEVTDLSIRNPCANQNIACIAPTQGLVSRDGAGDRGFKRPFLHHR